MIEITNEMLDIIEQVKGKRNPLLWDNRCETALKKTKNSSKSLKNLTKNELENKGRELGIELDKRHNKEKLIETIENLQKKG
tara:strand:- start:967 stop:1212 length:246 start_codon:yes stop_codon:yes gene_type:complete